MVETITKLVQITLPTDAVKQSITRLDTGEGRSALAEQLCKDIDEYCEKAFDDGPRSHLGASLIADKCKRHVWYSYRWFKHKVHSGRMQRLFQRGHREEDVIIGFLRAIGCNVEQADESGQQIRIYAVSNHFGGSTDGAFGLPERYGIPDSFLLEVKTSNEEWFGKMKDVAYDNKKHWGQMCVYGFKRGLHYAVYFYVNKNDDRIFVQVIELDWSLADRLINEASYIINTQEPPARISNRKDWWECKMCDHYALCQLRTVTPDRNCRTCTQSVPIENGQWACKGWDAIIPDKQAQLMGCDSWQGLEY